MRYIGNKTKLLDFIGDRLARCGVRGGRAVDAFAGTASVGSYLKSRGFSVTSCDVMTYSYVLQRAYVVADRYPTFRRLRTDADFETTRHHPILRAAVDERLGEDGPRSARPLAEVLVYLNAALDTERGFITRHFSAPLHDPGAGRTYFTRDNARRIDAIRRRVQEWREASLLNDDEYYLLLAALLEAADSVANTAGVYAAYVKSWQSNARHPLRLRVPQVVARRAGPCHAVQDDAVNVVVRTRDVDVLYLDPPYNARQYSGYYHVPELIARGWFDGAVSLRGKTGLIPDRAQQSDWSSRTRCVGALESLLARSSARHVLLSYNNEGIIPISEIRKALREYGRAHTYRCFSRHYQRYRADDRAYTADRTVEYLHYVRR